jgi:multiple sugar transport system ATP-binding protein
VVQQVGEPLELYNAPANRFVAGFIGSPAMNFATVRLDDADGALWASNDGIRIAVPAGIAGRLRDHAGREVAMGIRPEDLRIAGPGDAAELALDAVVEVIEKLGSEILLDTLVGRNAMVAAVEPTVRAARHERVRLAVNPERLHFFDTATDAAL